MKWESIFANYKLACYFLYKFFETSEPIIIKDFNEGIFFKTLIEQGYLNNEERAFEFFDQIEINCSIIPNGNKTFTSSTESHSRIIICNDNDSRREASLRALDNAFFFLEERELGRKKLKSVTS